MYFERIVINNLRGIPSCHGILLFSHRKEINMRNIIILFSLAFVLPLFVSCNSKSSESTFRYEYLLDVKYVQGSESLYDEASATVKLNEIKASLDNFAESVNGEKTGDWSRYKEQMLSLGETSAASLSKLGCFTGTILLTLNGTQIGKWSVTNK